MLLRIARPRIASDAHDVYTITKGGVDMSPLLRTLYSQHRHPHSGKHFDDTGVDDGASGSSSDTDSDSEYEDATSAPTTSTTASVSGDAQEDSAAATTVTVDLPVQFEDKYMKIVESYLNYFGSHMHALPTKIKVPVTIPIENMINPTILAWLRPLDFHELAQFRQVCMYFALDPLIDQLDGVLAGCLLSKPSTVYKSFHEPGVTLASSESATDMFPILK